MSSLLEKIDHYHRLFADQVARVKEAREVEALRQAFLGRKKGHLTLLFEEFKTLGPEEKKSAGRQLNELKAEIQNRLAELEQKLQAPARVQPLEDLTLPGRQLYWGAPHPITLFQREIERIFISMGFSVEEGPEIETDYYNFEALNFPPHHPARDAWDTLYINDKLLLRTHTSPVQIRVMEKKKPPIRIIIPGKVFRRETPDPTHLPMFYQVEGLVVDRGITFAHLKGTLEYFIKALFGEKIKLRFRPSFFPFTEPSAEVDIECIVCGGQDAACRVCGGSGWKEILGAGMVDPQVFKNVNIDPEVYSGWAFGLGIDRTAMFAFQIPEIRHFYENDLRFLRQFNRR
ncbi:MAG: Phenylalanyl-tRNA synthetase alpha chain [Candidatus Saccharicenans subterraneus]|uniref:Phenylalanine--tRNA ligase alpha subunit n=1 Tax=Candidatus Saccharicenans subterraneus TaxID=2508984 RepID=A0A3E2BQN1_9BACT|nr:MAG: Phenylalanyl-tRNA synthetase alpha chain [Candidatus Saccharicenans subterraneum]